MSTSFYIFNPEHDLALANADRNFVAPLSARKFLRDASALPIWYAPSGSSIIIGDCSSSDYIWEMQKLFPQLNGTELIQNPQITEDSLLHVWGWNRTVKKLFLGFGTPEHLLPTDIQLENIKNLSHRRTAIKAMHFLYKEIPDTGIFPLPAQEILNLEKAEEFAVKHHAMLFKAPWSGSGKGLSWVRGKLTESHRGWIKNTIEKQGSVIAEQFYDITENFAMLFSCNQGKVYFEGFSLFKAEKGIYRSNSLISNEAIVKELTEKHIQPELLQRVQNRLLEFIQAEIAPHYTGVLGVDMFGYEEDGKTKLHPCVEINLRMTMGYVARTFFDRFVHPEAFGRFYVDHNPVSGELWKDHCNRISNYPLKIVDGKLMSGYLALNDVQPHSNYRVRVEVTPTLPLSSCLPPPSYFRR